MRRRGVGVGAIKKRQDEAKAFTDTGRRLEEEKLAHVEELIGSFRKSLEEFAAKHRTRINEDPEFRQHFHRMCATIGVDPLASNKGFWADLLGVGNFYYELGIQVVQLCLHTRAENGGLMYLDDILSRLRRSQARSRQNVSIDDVRRAIEKLGVLGSGYKIIEVCLEYGNLA
jgi:ESCRT-II complex subunit VPS22